MTQFIPHFELFFGIISISVFIHISPSSLAVDVISLDRWRHKINIFYVHSGRKSIGESKDLYKNLASENVKKKKRNVLLSSTSLSLSSSMCGCSLGSAALVETLDESMCWGGTKKRLGDRSSKRPEEWKWISSGPKAVWSLWRKNAGSCSAVRSSLYSPHDIPYTRAYRLFVFRQ